MKTLLLPIDFENTSQHILEEGINFAKLLQAKVYIMHTISLDIGYILGETGFQYIPEIENNILEKETKKMNEYRQLLLNQNIENEIIINQGIPAEMIIDKADELKIDYIVMGSHARGLFFESFLGSVSKEVLKKSKVPVLIVPSKKK